MSNSKHETHVTETPDVSHIKNVDVTHEMSDVYVSGIVKFLVGLSVLTIATFILTWGLFRSFANNATEPPPSPMALTDKDRRPPEPRLQGAPGFAEDLEKTTTVRKEEPASGPAITAGAPQAQDPLYGINILRRRWSDVLANSPVGHSGQRFGLAVEKAQEKILKKRVPVR